MGRPHAPNEQGSRHRLLDGHGHAPAGVYPYLYDVDGGWHNDPADDGRMPTGWGNEYSVKVVR